jgi:hypothetical protein
MLRKGGTTRNGIQMNAKRVQDQVFITPAAGYNKCRVFEIDIPTGKDGFLATNSLLATIVLLTRACESSGSLSSGFAHFTVMRFA